MEGEADLEVAGEIIKAGRSISDSLGGILLRGSTFGATLWGRDICPQVLDGEDTREVAQRVLTTGDGK